MPKYKKYNKTVINIDCIWLLGRNVKMYKKSNKTKGFLVKQTLVGLGRQYATVCYTYTKGYLYKRVSFAPLRYSAK